MANKQKQKELMLWNMNFKEQYFFYHRREVEVQFWFSRKSKWSISYYCVSALPWFSSRIANTSSWKLKMIMRVSLGSWSFNSPRQKSGLVQTFWPRPPPRPFLDSSEFFKGHQVVKSPKKALKWPKKCPKKVKKGVSLEVWTEGFPPAPFMD